MSTVTENRCPRGLKNCTPADVIADENCASFVCVGWNVPQGRTVAQDRFTLCWKNSAIDQLGHWNRSDLLDTMCVIAQALSTDENVRVNEGVDESGMQAMNFV